MSLLTSVRSLRRTPYLKDAVKGRQRVCSVGYWLSLNSLSYEAVIPKRGVLQPREGSPIDTASGRSFVPHDKGRSHQQSQAPS